MPIPNYQSLMLPVLKASANGEVRIGDVVARLAIELDLTPEEQSALLASGKQTVFANRVHWAKSYLSKALLIELTRRGYFRITERGTKILSSHPDRIDNRYLARFLEFREFTERSVEKSGEELSPLSTGAAESDQTPDEVMRSAHRQIEASLAQDLLDRVRGAPSDFFERLIVRLLLGMGYGGSAADAGRALGRSGDDGVDGVIDQDALGLDRVYIQAKRYSAGNNVSPGEIRDFFGSLDHHKATKGLFVTTSNFSTSARRTAESLSKRIVLIRACRQLGDSQIG